MSLIVDTNVLIRAITLDDPTESRKSLEILRAPSVVISSQALCEMIWVLRRLYRRTHTELVAVVNFLVETENVVLDRPAVEAGLVCMEAGGDFADGIIAFEGRRLGGEITALAISHQSAVVEVADVVYWMRDGETEPAYSRSAAVAG